MLVPTVEIVYDIYCFLMKNIPLAISREANDDADIDKVSNDVDSSDVELDATKGIMGDDINEDYEIDDNFDARGAGFSNVLQKILGQIVDTKNPVLSKRKTSVMREIEKERESRDRLKKLRVQRASDRQRHLVTYNIDYYFFTFVNPWPSFPLRSLQLHCRQITSDNSREWLLEEY